MTTTTNTTIENQVDAGYETSTFALGVGISMAALVGIWGTACLVNAMISMGPLTLAQGYFSALIG